MNITTDDVTAAVKRAKLTHYQPNTRMAPERGHMPLQAVADYLHVSPVRLNKIIRARGWRPPLQRDQIKELVRMVRAQQGEAKTKAD